MREHEHIAIGVIHSHGAFERQSRKLAASYPYVEDDRIFSPQPFFWVGGLIVAGAVVAHGEREAAILLRRGQVEGFSVVEPFLVAVSEDDDGTLEPLSLREKIRASGLTFETIAAEAVRYA